MEHGKFDAFFKIFAIFDFFRGFRMGFSGGLSLDFLKFFQDFFNLEFRPVFRSFNLSHFSGLFFRDSFSACENRFLQIFQNRCFLEIRFGRHFRFPEFLFFSVPILAPEIRQIVPIHGVLEILDLDFGRFFRFFGSQMEFAYLNLSPDLFKFRIF